MTDAELTPAVQTKLDQCKQLLREMRRVVVAFSAGVDSSLLLAIAARALGAQNVLAAIGTSPSLPQRELEDAKKIAAGLQVELVQIPTGEMDDPRYAANPANRCYFCKDDLFRRLIELARERGFSAVASGANADDVGDFRPGLQAGRELGVQNPLMDAKLTKAEIREISRAWGLPTCDKPAMACLASRIPYGEAITAERLHKIELAENALKDMGFTACRVRDHQAVARIELPAADFAVVMAQRERIVETLKKIGYTFVSLDLQPLRSGSMNALLE